MDVPNNEIFHLSRYSVDRKCIEITEGVSSVPEYHFRDYDKLISIKFPLSIRRIGNYAFKGCSSFTMNSFQKVYQLLELVASTNVLI